MLRDDAWDFVLAKTTWFSPLCDVDIGEAIGLHTNLEWTSDLQLDNIDFALDSKKVVDACRIGVDDNNEFGCIVYAC
jgi:hypothetical protein